MTSGSPSTIGFTVTFTATVAVVSPGMGTPTGTVTFKDGGSTLGSSALMNGQASFSTSSLTIGSHMITAVYGGSTDFTGSTSNTVTQDVVAGQADHFVVTAPTTVQAGAPFSFTVTAKDSMGNVATSSSNTPAAHVRTGDCNGDGASDIAARDPATGNWWIGVSNGSAFTTSLWATWSTGVTWVDVKVGDFNGDGKADIVGRALELGTWWVGLSTGSAFSTTQWAAWSTKATWVDVQVGAFNGDGNADMTARYKEGGIWWTGIA